MDVVEQQEKDMFTAAVDLLRRTGAATFQVRYSDDEDPTVWMAIGQWGDTTEVAAALSPLPAVIRLLERVMDGGECNHCGKTTGVTEDFDVMPLAEHVCWYQFDPELKKFRRGCE